MIPDHTPVEDFFIIFKTDHKLGSVGRDRGGQSFAETGDVSDLIDGCDVGGAIDWGLWSRQRIQGERHKEGKHQPQAFENRRISGDGGKPVAGG